MTQHGTAPTDKHRRHPPAVKRDLGSTHCIDPAPDRMQPTRLDAMFHRLPTEPSFEELPSRNHTVLTPC